MLRLFSIFLAILFFHPSIGQTTFEYLLESDIDHWPRNIIEKDNEYIINNWQDRKSTLIIKIDNNGILIDSVGFYNDDGFCMLGNILNADSNHIIGLGLYTSDTLEYLWFVKFKPDLSIIEEKYHYIKDYNGMDVQAIINQNGNIIMAALIEKGILDFKSCVIELDQNGEILKYKEYESSGMLQYFYDILEDTTNNLYKLFGLKLFERSISIINLDTDLNVHSQSYMWYWDEQNTAKWISEDRYLLTGKLSTSGGCDMKIFKMLSNDDTISSALFGEPKMFDVPGIINNLDFINLEEIYYAGMKGYTWPEPFHPFPNELVLCKLDSGLNVEWQRTYGGDANYYLHTVLATTDGGFIMCAGRYDHNYQDEELDVYILKVDSNGILTSLTDVESQRNEVFVYPNPASSYINIASSSYYNIEIVIYDLHGHVILHEELNGSNHKINIECLSPDLYIYKVWDDNGFTDSGKLIVR